jgi:2-phospho-L-lactate/phosphoenolpyruvate guanylyltransferase
MIVVPFRATGKSRLPATMRRDLSLAMLGDVLAVAAAVGATRLVTDSDAGGKLARKLGVQVVDDPGLGQGAAVAAALAGVEGVCVIVNSDLPAVTLEDLELLAAPARRGGCALVEASDGTTNALALPSGANFESLYGPGSAARFRAHATSLALPVTQLELPNLIADVDTLEDLERLVERAGARTRELLALAVG